MPQACPRASGGATEGKGADDALLVDQGGFVFLDTLWHAFYNK
jgi:hypothetical protein